MTFCTNCGAKLEEGLKFCTSCGMPISEEDQNTRENKIINCDSANNIQNVNISNRIESNEFNIKEEKPVAKEPQKVNRSSKKAWHMPVLITSFILLILIIVFLDQIKGGYYVLKYKSEENLVKKFDYAIESLKNLKLDSSIDALKLTVSELIKQNNSIAESKLLEIKAYIKEEEFKELSKDFYDQKALSSVETGKFDDALNSLVKFQQNGGNIKDNKNYEIIMLNIISKVTNSPLYDVKEVLQEKRGIYFDNLDEDPFDEVIELKDLNTGGYYSKSYQLNLYKLINNNYQRVYSEKIESVEWAYIDGIYKFDKDKKGLYLNIAYGKYNHSGSVYKVKNNNLISIGDVSSFYSCSVQDYDKDGIYEISTLNLDDPYNIYGSYPETPKIKAWYKFIDDGNRKPQSVSEEKIPGEIISSTPTVTQNVPVNKEFIFPESNKRYLTDNEVSILSKDDLGIARNEIFARHGFVFKTEKYVQYFYSKGWYSPNSSYDGSESSLNEYEKANYKLIQKWEKLK